MSYFHWHEAQKFNWQDYMDEDRTFYSVNENFNLDKQNI